MRKISLSMFMIITVAFLFAGVENCWCKSNKVPKPLVQHLHRIDFSSKDFSIKFEGEFARVTPMTDRWRFEYLNNPGEPQLPSYALFFSIPYRSKITSVEMVNSSVIQTLENITIFPAQAPAILSLHKLSSKNPEFVQANPAIYNSGKQFPENVIEMGVSGFIGNKKISTCIVYPFRYYPHDKKLEILGDIELAIDLSEEIVQSSESIVHSPKSIVHNSMDIIDLSDLYSQSFPAFDRRGFPTPQKKRDKNVPPIEEEGYKDKQKEFILPPGDYKYVIITGQFFITNFQPLADWKTKKGVPATIVSVGWIENNYFGIDTQAKIRNFIKNAANTWGTKWVLLGGDTDVVPERFAFAMDCEAGYYPDENDLACDLYYSGLDGNWDANGNGIYGEVTDNVDLFADVYVGRAPVSNAGEVDTFVTKILKYETDPPSDYQENMLFAAEVLWNDPYTDGAVAKDYIDEEFIPPQFDPITKLYASQGNESPTSVRNALNQGQGFFNHNGHAFIDIMGAGTGYFDIYDADALSNGFKQGVIFSIGCWPAAFDYDCIGEHFINNANGGAIAFVGNSSYGWGSPGNPLFGYSDRFDQYFYHLIFNENINQLGAVLASMKAHYTPYSSEENVYRWCIYQINLLGDPESSLWTKVPGNIVADYPSTVPVGESSITVTVSDNGTPLENARVCVMKSTEFYQYGLTDDCGQVSLDIAPITAGFINVTVTGENYLPFEGTISAISDFAYLFLENYTIQDYQLDTNPGYVDGKVNPGETVDMTISLRNFSSETAEGVTASISSTNPDVTILDAGDTFGDILPGESVICQGIYQFSASPSCIDGEVIYFDVEIQTGGDLTWNEILGVPIAGAKLLYQDRVIDDSAGNGNGIPEPGETLDIDLSIRNHGSGTAINPQVNLSTTDSYITLNSSSSSYPDIPPDGNMSADTPFNLSIGQLCPLGHVATINANLQAENFSYTDSFILVVGETGFEDNVEGGAGNWTHSGSGDLWHISQNRFHSFIHSWYCGSEFSHSYNNGMNATLTSPAIYLEPNSILSFWRWFAFPMYGADGAYVEINGGLGWTTLDFIGSGGALPDVAPGKVLPHWTMDYEQELTVDQTLGLQSDWFEEKYDLSDYIGAVQIRFRFSTDSYDTAEGIYIDDIKISVPGPPTPIPTSSPTATPTINQTNTPTSTPTDLPTDTPTITPSGFPTGTPTSSPTTSTFTPSSTPTQTATPTVQYHHVPIMFGGYWDTDIASAIGGTLSLLVIITEPGIEKAELLYDGIPLEIYLYDDGYHGDFAPDDNIFGNLLGIPPDAPKGKYTIEVGLKVNEKYLPGPWPYLYCK